MATYKYMEVKYTLAPEGTGIRWKVSNRGLYGTGFSQNRKDAKDAAERWIRSALR